MLKCVVLSECAVPLPQRRRAEGGGLRAWGLAHGLAANANGYSVTLAYPSENEKEVGQTHDGIRFVTWSRASLPTLLRAFDSVIVSYCAFNLTSHVLEAMQPAQQLILDCNVPFYVEVSARRSEAVDTEFRDFTAGLATLARTLSRGDLFMCASERQKVYYQGVLSALGRLNPATYGVDLLQSVPYGVSEERPVARSRPIDKLTARPRSLKLLWFGAVYPWFDIENLLEAVTLLNERGMDVSLTVVGARNPTSTHPDFLAAFAAFDRLLATPRYAAHTFSQAWVDFDERADWYLNADLGVMISRPGLENSLAWRTRLVDMVWARVPVATNAGDPLGDQLVERGAAVLLPLTDAAALANGLQATLGMDLERLRARLDDVREELTWPRVTRGLASCVRTHAKAPDLLSPFAELRQRADDDALPPWRRRFRHAEALLEYRQRHGVLATVRHVGDRLLRRLRRFCREL